MHTHTCSCGASYQSSDPDPYFCDACVAQRKALAAEIDAKRAANPPAPQGLTGFARYDALPKVRGFVNANDIL